MTRLLLCISFMLCIAATSFASTLNFAAGKDRSSYASPFLVQTTNQGQSWVLQNIPELPSSGFFQTGACSDLICIAAGSNYDDSSLLIQTIDGGIHWNAVLLPETSSAFTFYGSSCSDNMCIAVGVDHEESVLAQTTDRGVTWSLIDLSQITTGYLLSAKCLDDYCIAVGHENGNPLMIQTNDKGNTWLRVAYSGDDQPGSLNAIDCNDHHCVAVGSTQLSAAPFSIHSRPIIIESNHTKSRWTQQSFDNTQLTGSFSSVHCETYQCIAVGNNYERYFIAERNLNQSSWHFQKMPVSHNGFLTSIDCNNQYCFATGYIYYDAKKILLSNRKGSWQPETFPMDDSTGKLNTINCHEEFCFAVGESEGAPLLLQLTDHDWEAVNIAEMTKSGEFFVATSGF